MKKALSLIICLFVILTFVSCESRTPGDSPSEDHSMNDFEKGEEKSLPQEEFSYPADIEEIVSEIEIKTVSGTENCWNISENTVTFTHLDEDTVCSVSGKWAGSIIIDTGDDHEFELELCGITVLSDSLPPIVSYSNSDITLTAKKGYENFIYDKREENENEDELLAAITSAGDMTLGGKGSLTVLSENYGGVRTKDDLKLKNLTLNVKSSDTSLRGSDGIKAENCTFTLISSKNDGIKTSNSDISSKGNQKGCVNIQDCTGTICSAHDGIDAAYDVTIGGGTVIGIFTGKYSSYTEAAETSSFEIKTPSFQGNPPGGRPGGPGGPGGSGGRPGGPGGFNDGNSDKSDISSKGIKSSSSVLIESGVINIVSYDDSIHANSETAENGETTKGSVTVNDGEIVAESNDDGIHADGELVINGGKVTVSNSYEGLEGLTVTVNGGRVSVVSKDDGFNSTSKSGSGIEIKGGYVYVFAGGDGFDANSSTQYSGIVFDGGNTVIISTSDGNSAIDTERGYAYTSGTVVAVSPSGGMSNECVNCKNFSSVGTKKNLSLSKGTFLVIDGDNTGITVKMPASVSAQVVSLGFGSAAISTSSNCDLLLDENGVGELK